MSKFDEAHKPRIPLTEETFAQLKSKTYESGRVIKVGDTILFGLLFLEEYHYRLIMYHKEEVNTLYKLLPKTNYLPKLKLLI